MRPGKPCQRPLMTNPRILVVESARAYQNVLREIATLVGVECMFTDRLEAALVSAERGRRVIRTAWYVRY